MRWAWLGAVLALMACGQPVPIEVDAGLLLPTDAGDAFADAVVRFEPGEGAGFGQDRFPDIVLGPPKGAGASQGSLDVLSLGRGGVIVLEFSDFEVVDGPGVDFLVFENPFTGFVEPGIVEVSEDGMTWKTFPCDDARPFTGCAGLNPVFANPAQNVSATDPSVSGGDAFDLVTVGLSRARFVRITDSGNSPFYAAPGGGFDLDAISVVNGQRVR